MDDGRSREHGSLCRSAVPSPVPRPPGALVRLAVTSGPASSQPILALVLPSPGLFSSSGPAGLRLPGARSWTACAMCQTGGPDRHCQFSWLEGSSRVISYDRKFPPPPPLRSCGCPPWGVVIYPTVDSAKQPPRDPCRKYPFECRRPDSIPLEVRSCCLVSSCRYLGKYACGYDR